MVTLSATKKAKCAQNMGSSHDCQFCMPFKCFQTKVSNSSACPRGGVNNNSAGIPCYGKACCADLDDDVELGSTELVENEETAEETAEED